jgi:hypothetical protein
MNKNRHILLNLFMKMNQFFTLKKNALNIVAIHLDLEIAINFFRLSGGLSDGKAVEVRRFASKSKDCKCERGLTTAFGCGKHRFKTLCKFSKGKDPEKCLKFRMKDRKEVKKTFEYGNVFNLKRSESEKYVAFLSLKIVLFQRP